jgi:hypothetical protein
MKEQLRQEINLLWEQILLQKEQGLSAKTAEERLGRLTVILRDIETADSAAAAAKLAEASYHVTTQALR